jgi:hypothetical protein
MSHEFAEVATGHCDMERWIGLAEVLEPQCLTRGARSSILECDAAHTKKACLAKSILDLARVEHRSFGAILRARRGR